MKFLIVDDSTAIRECIKALLPATYEIRECDNGADAVAIATSRWPDWILMDIEMAGMDGLTATRFIRAAWLEARIIFVTSHDEPRFREEATRLRVDGYVVKDKLENINFIIHSTATHQPQSRPRV